MTAAAELEPGRAAVVPASDRPGLQVASVASGLLVLLDAHRLTGRLPLEIQVHVGRLRHAVKVAIQAQAASQPGVTPPTAQPEVDAGAALRAWIADQPWAQPGPQGWVYLLCFRDPANAIPAAARYLVDHGARHHLDQAIYAYNHSWAYVAKVKALARRYTRGGGQ